MSGSEPVCTLGAVGDIVLVGPAAAEINKRGAGWLFQEVMPVLGRADVLFGNLECAFLPAAFPRDKLDPRGMVGTRDLTPVLKEAGFDVLSLANNHILDGGTIGLFHTAELVEAQGILAAGVGATQAEARRLRVLDRGGLRVGFLCYGEDSNHTLSTAGPCHAYYEPAVVLEDIALTRAEVDVLVVSVHADLEFVETPSPARRAAFREFARAGATVVVGHHPHVPQGVERIGSSLVAYSLGNFVFNSHTSDYMRAHLPNTARTFVLLVQLSTAGVHDFTRVPVQITRRPGERPQPASGRAGVALAAHLEELDRLVANDARVAANWRAAAVSQLQANVRYAASLDQPDAVLHTLGSLLHVAENRAWTEEVHAAASELWERQREEIDEYRRPGFVRSGFRRSSPTPLPRKALRWLARRVRT